MNVKEIMTKDVIVVSPETSLGRLAKIVKQGLIHGVVVLNEDGIVTGVITMTDLLRILQHMWYWSKREKGMTLKDMIIKSKDAAIVKDHMTKKESLHTISQDAQAEEILELMCKHGVHTIPVVSEDNKLIGVVGASDIVETFFNV